jgi:hypothetical protein
MCESLDTYIQLKVNNSVYYSQDEMLNLNSEKILFTLRFYKTLVVGLKNYHEFAEQLVERVH